MPPPPDAERAERTDSEHEVIVHEGIAVEHTD